jgi:hypothetical protein
VAGGDFRFEISDFKAGCAEGVVARRPRRGAKVVSATLAVNPLRHLYLAFLRNDNRPKSFLRNVTGGESVREWEVEGAKAEGPKSKVQRLKLGVL